MLFVANKKRRKISCLKSLIDPCFSLEIDRWGAGGEEEIGSPNQKKFFGVGRIGKSGWVGGGGGYWSGKKSQDLKSQENGISEYGYYQLN